MTRQQVYRMQANEHCIIGYWKNAQDALDNARLGYYDGDAMARLAVVMKSGPASLRPKAKRTMELVQQTLDDIYN